MRACGDLAVLCASAQAGVARMRKIVVDAASQMPARPAKQAIAITTLDLLNAWNSFSRSYALSCIMKPRRVRGGRVTVTRTGLDFNGVIGIMVAKHRRFATPSAAGIWHRRDEPPWHDTAILVDCCRELGCSHITQVEAAVSLQSRAFGDLPVFRNFFAHRNKGTAKAARDLAPRYSIPSSRHPLEILTSAPTGRPYPLLVDWIDDIAVTVELLCE